MASLISVLIPTVRGHTLETAIRAVLRQTHKELELLVAAQGSDPQLHDVLDRLSREDSRVKPIRLTRMGVSLARNAALKEAKGDVIAMTDDDCEPREDWLDVLRDIFEREPETGVIGGALIAPKPTRRGPYTCPQNLPSESLYDPKAAGYKAPQGWDWFTANVAVRRSAADLVGPFDENLGPGTPFPGWEDPDWKIRLEDLNVKMRVTPRSVVNHTHGIRYGVAAILKHLRNYSGGAGGFAGKMSLKGDRRGAELYRATLERARTLHKSLPADVLRWHYFETAYQLCLREYEVKPGTTLLVPRRG